MCVDLSLGFLFCSIDLYVCLFASTILSWWLTQFILEAAVTEVHPDLGKKIMTSFSWVLKKLPTLSRTQFTPMKKKWSIASLPDFLEWGHSWTIFLYFIQSWPKTNLNIGIISAAKWVLGLRARKKEVSISLSLICILEPM